MRLKVPFAGDKKNPFADNSESPSKNEGNIDFGERLRESSLWTIASVKPKSERFSQLSFEGFRPKGKNKLEQLFYTINEFLFFLFRYSRRKVGYVVKFFRNSTVGTVSFSLNSKSWLVRKLIWSRGRLGRPIATAFVMSVAFLVFMFGEVFNSSKFVNSQEISPDYVSNVTDIIPQKETAVTTIPESRKQAEAFTYTVQPGDTLSSIGNKFKISTDAIKYVNSLTDSSILSVGKELTIPPVTGLIHKVARGDTLASISKKYEVAPQAIADFNYILDTTNLAVGTELVVPDAKVPQPVVVPSYNQGIITPTTFAPAPNVGSNWCIWPTTARIITQYFALYHNGLDIAVSGAVMPPIYACGSGSVTRSGWDPFGLGLHVVIDHGNGYQTVYGHMSRLDVSYGQGVSQGQVIGVMGNTGRSTGPHVHFMVKYNGAAQNPLSYIQ